MALEVLSRVPSTPRRRTPLLFVHGAWHGAWCWDEGFLQALADRGYAAHALSLRGHGASPLRGSLRRVRLADYVADVAEVAAGFDTPPVLIGHSMGGAVVQKLLETQPAPAAVLLAAVPPSGVLPTLLSVHRRFPRAALRMHATLSLYPLVQDPERVRALFFSPQLPEAELARHAARMQDESYAAFLDMLALNLPRPRRVRTPLLVLGGERDTIFGPKRVAATARAYGTQARMFDMAHDMMLEPGWPALATHIGDWLDERALP